MRVDDQRTMQTKVAEPQAPKSIPTPGVLPSADRAVGHPFLRLQQSLGNQVLARLIQTRLAISQPGDGLEQEADQLANQVVARPLAIASGGYTTHEANGEAVRRSGVSADVTERIRAQEADGTPTVSGPSGGCYLDHSPSHGKPLPQPLRTSMEARLGADFQDVRVYTGDAAASMNRQLNAKAFTTGQHIYFGEGRYHPDSREGQRLLAHELVHTLQQRPEQDHPHLPNYAHTRRSALMIQRDVTESQAIAAITARRVFPFPQGSRLVLNRIMPDEWFHMLSSLQPDVGTALQAIERQVATVTTSTDDLFEATLSTPVSLPAEGDRPQTTLNNVVMSLRRHPSGTFDLELSGQSGPQASPTVLFAQRDLTATAESGGIVLSSGVGPAAVPQLRTSPSTAGQVRIETYTAPYLSQVPEWIRGSIPQRIQLLQLTRLPDVRPGTVTEQQAIETVASQVSGQRRMRRQRLLGGIGVQSAAGSNLLLGASWQINFTPIQSAGSLFQVPLEVQLQYAPTSSILAQVSSGAEVSLSQFNIPVNIRLVSLGLAGGTMAGSAPEAGAERPVLPAFGPTLGAGAGLELGSFRTDLRYEHFFNLIEASPNADAVTLRFGGAF